MRVNKIFIKLLIKMTVLSLAGFVMICSTAVAQQKTSQLKHEKQIDEIGPKLLKDPAFNKALNQMDKTVILNAYKEIAGIYPKVYANKASKEEMNVFNGRLRTMFHEADASGLSNAVFKMLPISKDYDFSNPYFIQREAKLSQKYLGVNISNDITRIVNHIEKNKSKIFARQASEHQMEPKQDVSGGP